MEFYFNKKTTSFENNYSMQSLWGLDESHVIYFNNGTIFYIMTVCDLTLCDLTIFFIEISVTICSSFCLLETLAQENLVFY